MPEPTHAEEPVLYVYQVTLTAGQPLTAQKVNIEPDCDFMLTGVHGSSTGTYSINFKLPSGRSIANAQIKNTNLVGTANQPTAIGPSPIYRKAGIGPSLEITDTSGASNTIELCFSGIRRYPIASA